VFLFLPGYRRAETILWHKTSLLLLQTTESWKTPGLQRLLLSVIYLLRGFVCFWWDWSLLCTCKAGALLLEPHLSSFCSGYFGDEVSQAVFTGWPWSYILSSSASQIAAITGVSHQLGL
jgi:hypothetical protein